jgi:hypothetical protein
MQKSKENEAFDKHQPEKPFMSMIPTTSALQMRHPGLNAVSHRGQILLVSADPSTQTNDCYLVN